MAGRAQESSSQSVQPIPRDRTEAGVAVIEVPKDEVQLAAARLYGQGLKRGAIMRVLLDLLAPVQREGKRDRTREEREALARGKLRRWERNEQFRDMVYEHAVVKLDMEIPGILQGMAKKAHHRVDAARLALEVTHRHNPKGDQQPPNITVQIANIPRPE